MAQPKEVARQPHERLAQERRIKAVDEWRDIRQQDVARAIEEPPVNYNRYETGTIPIPDRVLDKAATYFGVTRAYLRYGEGPRKMPAGGGGAGEVSMPRPASLGPVAAARKKRTRRRKQG